jgi:exonuclease SbcD
MRLLHTSDWHLGHTLRDVERTYEHRAFLGWLVQQICAKEVDALLIAGDVFDVANPSAVAQEMWYAFLAQAVRERPGLNIVTIAGNHDSAARLEAPDHLLRSFRIRVVGTLPTAPDGGFDPGGVLVRLEDWGGHPTVAVLAMPFLRVSDLPEVEAEDPLIGGVRELYRQGLDVALAEGLPVIAMGHCFMVDGQVSEASERKVLNGNLHALPLNIFPAEVAYAALGHLHLPQVLGNGRVRYSGSPIPLSMSERHYSHSVTLLDLQGDGSIVQETLRIPRTVDFLRIPDQGFLTPDEALDVIRAMEAAPAEAPARPRPFMEVGLTLQTYEPGLLARVQEALDTKGYFLASLPIQYTGTGAALAEASDGRNLQEWTVEEIFRKKWHRDFADEPGPAHIAALNELIDEVGQEGA